MTTKRRNEDKPMTNLGQDEDKKGLPKGGTDRKYIFTETFHITCYYQSGNEIYWCHVQTIWWWESSPSWERTDKIKQKNFKKITNPWRLLKKEFKKDILGMLSPLIFVTASVNHSDVATLSPVLPSTVLVIVKTYVRILSMVLSISFLNHMITLTSSHIWVLVEWCLGVQPKL